MGQFSINGANVNEVNPYLLAILEQTAALSPYDVVLFSGRRNGSGGSLHDHGSAVDIVLRDQNGNYIPNLGASGAAFEAYQAFANAARGVQEQIAPELNGKFEWGGYYGPTSLNPTGADLMHFGVRESGAQGSLGSWGTGLNSAGLAHYSRLGAGQIYSPESRGPAPAAWTPSGNTAYGNPAAQRGREPERAPAAPAAQPTQPAPIAFQPPEQPPEDPVIRLGEAAGAFSRAAGTPNAEPDRFTGPFTAAATLDAPQFLLPTQEQLSTTPRPLEAPQGTPQQPIDPRQQQQMGPFFRAAQARPAPLAGGIRIRG